MTMPPADPLDPGAPQRFRLFGDVVSSTFPFVSHLIPAAGAAVDLDVRRSHEPAPAPAPADPPRYRSPDRTADGEPICLLFALEDGELMRFPGLADFVIRRGAVDIHPAPGTADPAAERLDALIEIRFLGAVLSYLHEGRGEPVLHASAVSINGRAAAFLAGNRGGKTGLAATLLRSGRDLLSDDLVPVREDSGVFSTSPGYPQLRMWPDAAAHFLGAASRDLPRVHPDETKRRVPCSRLGRFADAPCPLSVLYLPERRADPSRRAPIIEIVPVPPRDALIELVRRSFSPYLVEAVGLQATRLERFARLVERVPIRRLIYRDGFDHLAEVAERIEADLQSSGSGQSTVNESNSTGVGASCKRST